MNPDMHETQSIDLDSLQVTSPVKNGQIICSVKQVRAKFLRGPIQWPWLAAASKLPGKALHVAIAIHFLNGFRLTGTVQLSPSILRELGLNRYAGYRGVKELEKAALISVNRGKGRSPVITLCNAGL